MGECKKCVLVRSYTHNRVANLRNTRALKKSCEHLTSVGFEQQVVWMAAARSPEHIRVAVAECLLGKHRLKENSRSQQVRQKEKVFVILYIHRMSHNLKKIAMWSNTEGKCFPRPISS